MELDAAAWPATAWPATTWLHAISWSAATWQAQGIGCGASIRLSICTNAAASNATWHAAAAWSAATSDTATSEDAASDVDTSNAAHAAIAACTCTWGSVGCGGWCVCCSITRRRGQCLPAKAATAVRASAAACSASRIVNGTAVAIIDCSTISVGDVVCTCCLQYRPHHPQASHRPRRFCRLYHRLQRASSRLSLQRSLLFVHR